MTSTSSVEFKGQVVVISGAATGIGKASAQLIASRGATVIALDFNAAALTDLSKELSLVANQSYVCDISSQDQIDKAISAILKDHGKIDALVNTAGIVGPSNTVVVDVSGIHTKTNVVSDNRCECQSTLWLVNGVGEGGRTAIAVCYGNKIWARWLIHNACARKAVGPLVGVWCNTTTCTCTNGARRLAVTQNIRVGALHANWGRLAECPALACATSVVVADRYAVNTCWYTA